MTVYYRGEKYKNTLGNGCLKCEGKRFFAQIKKGDPEGYIVVHTDKEVPECIADKPYAFDGWLELPKCASIGFIAQ